MSGMTGLEPATTRTPIRVRYQLRHIPILSWQNISKIQYVA
ncbi:hypothetical protein CCAN2_920004 [Capnocytophaga canimorsus]|nr:hypothetical protein CCAN2_920004 [Capnocytophaga canimorsus]